jgi:RNA-directed DNA polymerase
MTKLGLTLNEAKTSVRDARNERFDFLGDTFGPHRDGKDGQWYPGASPSKKSVQRIKTIPCGPATKGQGPRCALA